MCHHLNCNSSFLLCKKYEHNFQYGKQHGEQKYWYENGNPMYRLNFKTGMKHGLHKHWESTGELEHIRNYVDDNLRGEQKTWSGGKLKYKHFIS